MNRLLKISHAFSQAAPTYDTHAFIQRFTAQRLASKILSQRKGSLGTVLEIGCGTGILSAHLVNHADFYVLTDVSFPLLKKAQEKTREKKVFPLIVDAEQLCFSASFDLIASNLALHWFQDPKAALTRLAACLKPGGSLYITTLGNNTFHEWRTAHRLADAPCGILDFLSFGQLKNGLPLSGIRHVEEEWVSLDVGDALHFLRCLKAMGGHLAHMGHKPLSYKIFKRVLEIYNSHPQISCQILYGIYQKPQKVREE